MANSPVKKHWAGDGAGLPWRRGLTFPELMIGMMMTALVAAATAGLTSAVGSSWRATDASQTIQTNSRQSAQLVKRLVCSARYIGLATADGEQVGATPSDCTGATLMVWAQDTNADNSMQAGELAVIQFDPADKVLWLYQIDPAANAARTVCAASDLATSASATQFKTLCGRPYALARNVTSARFALNKTTSGSPSVEMTLKFSYGGQDQTEYATATMRAPCTQAVQ